MAKARQHNSDQENPPDPRQTINILGIELPLTKWAASAIAALAVVAMAGIVYLKVLAPAIEIRRNEKIDKQLTEFKKHFGEEPDFKTTVLDKLQISHYSTDGCLLVGRRTSPASALLQVWVPDPNIIPRQEAPGYISEKGSDTTLISRINLVSPAEAQNSCGGVCQFPHPGDPKWWNGEQRDCWVQVWRQWQDGCTHYQWWNTCNSYWDTNPDGSPRLYWTCCVH